MREQEKLEFRSPTRTGKCPRCRRAGIVPAGQGICVACAAESFAQSRRIKRQAEREAHEQNRGTTT